MFLHFIMSSASQAERSQQQRHHFFICHIKIKMLKIGEKLMYPETTEIFCHINTKLAALLDWTGRQRQACGHSWAGADPSYEMQLHPVWRSTLRKKIKSGRKQCWLSRKLWQWRRRFCRTELRQRAKSCFNAVSLQSRAHESVTWSSPHAPQPHSSATR